MGGCHLGAAWLKHGNLKAVVLCATGGCVLGEQHDGGCSVDKGSRF